MLFKAPNMLGIGFRVMGFRVEGVGLRVIGFRVII